ncbi:enoyl-CoA hydratase, partial [Burkholderia pseudomallei]|nr:enoyl-CoA hydratase [Burkholderia pseudomallei]MBF3543076.1 enoyl-CoA hydratase [Burkholderia pseudomallei]MBF3605219.1 enoyl-CoA hydratase [Burkholderia pseudomallei]MBF3605258.1 enoyl-CoA hydratase [Burkholderia pseudomallei]
MTDLALYAGYEALRIQRRPHGIVEIVMSGEGANRSGLAVASEA